MIVRYYALRKQGGGLKEKILEKPEAEAILSSGLSLAISYQYNNGAITTFNAKRAKQDAIKCCQKADEIGQPKESAIYFGVDEGWNRQAEITKVTEYFQTIKDVVRENGNRFQIGIYGSGLMCAAMEKRKLAKFFWIAGLSDGWPGRPDFVRTGKWNLYQNILEVPVGAVKVDTDIVNPKEAFIGSFHRPTGGGPNVVDSEITDQPSFNEYRLVKGVGNVLVESNGRRTNLAASKMVRRISEAGDLTLVDVPRQIKAPSGDGKIADFVRGHCRTSALVRIDQDPS